MMQSKRARTQKTLNRDIRIVHKMYGLRVLRVLLPIFLVFSFVPLAPYAKGQQVIAVEVFTNNFLNNSTAKADAVLFFDVGPPPSPDMVDNVSFEWYRPNGTLACSDLADPNEEAVARGFCRVDQLGEWYVNVTYEGNTSISDNNSFYVVADHWGPGIYIVSRTTLVSGDATLVIEPGTIVAFDENKKLGVEGRLVARGNESQPIVFTSNKTIKSPGDWDSIIFYNTSDPSSVIDYIEIEYSREGLTLKGASPAVTNSTFSNNTVRAIYAESSTSLIKNNTILKGGGEILPYGIYSTQSNLTLEKNTIQGMNVGVYMLRSNISMEGNLVTNCESFGILAKSTFLNSTNESVVGNRNGVKLESGSNGNFYNLNIVGWKEGFIVQDSSNATLWNSTIDLVEIATFDLAGTSNIVVTNCTFWRTDYNPGVVIGSTDDSILTIRNFLIVEALSQDNGTYLEDAIVRVYDGTILAHETRTGSDGATQPLLVTDRTYSPTLVENTTRVHVALWNLSFENNNRSVDMGSGHTETFWGSIYDLDGDGEPDFSDEDVDGDGLRNDLETGIGTNPRNPDSDGDGIADGYEVDHSEVLDPLDPADAPLDHDGDGLSNLEEYLNGTLPEWADSDEDGLDDPLELDCGMDPLDNTDAYEDWDDDGFSNAKECKAGTDLFDPEEKPPAPGPNWLLIMSTLGIAVLAVVAVVFIVLRRRKEPPAESVKESEEESSDQLHPGS